MQIIIEVINAINNKSYIELNNEVYYNILKDINKISPDYLDNKTNLIQDKNKLFNLTKDIVDKINLEINEINRYINLYSVKYINDNNYNFDYNLYDFRRYFTDEFLNTLFNEFKLIIKEALEVHYIQLLRENFDLAFQYFNEVQSLINKAPSNRILGSVFINNYANYKSTFQEFAYLPSSNEFLKFIEENFYNVSNYVLDYINKKIQSVNKYYFNESQRDEFYRLELIEQEIERVSSNIKNFFNELNLETEINTMILNITFDQISTLNSENIKTLDNLYKNIYRETQETRIYGSGCDVVRLIIRKKRTKVIKHKLVYDYYCRATAKSQKNINKIIRNLTVTKQYLSQNFSNHIIIPS